MIALAEAQFQRFAEDLSLLIERIRDGDTGRAKEAAQTLKDLEKALQTVFEERTKVEKLRRQEAGVVHDYALDFDEARDEVGRRLALLRAAGNG